MEAKSDFTRLRRVAQRGSAAVEFALIAPLFLALVFSIAEAGWYYFVNTAVERANESAARLVRTGQAQTAKDSGGVNVYSADAFYNEICSVVAPFGACDDTLTVDVARFASFDALASDTSSAVCRNSDNPTIKGAQFDASDYGAQNEIIRVRICFLYKPVSPILGLQLSTNKDGRAEIVASSIFRNEPFGI